jgi:hypothetical protein
MGAQNSEVYDIYYHPDGYIVMNWKGYATSEQFRHGTQIMLDLLMENQAHKVLADIKDMLIIGQDDQKWLETQFLPKAIKLGFKAIAMVKPNSYFNKVAVETISYKVDKEKLAIVFFDTTDEARQWISSDISL